MCAAAAAASCSGFSAIGRLTVLQISPGSTSLFACTFACRFAALFASLFALADCCWCCGDDDTLMRAENSDDVDDGDVGDNDVDDADDVFPIILSMENVDFNATL